MARSRDRYRPPSTPNTNSSPKTAVESHRKIHRFGQDKSNHGFSFRSRPGFHASQRELMTYSQTSAETSLIDLKDGQNRFRNVDDLTDSEEAEMDASDDEETDAQPNKRLRVSTSESAPRWSNPDPYTSLPPPQETNGKKLNVIRLIRKARKDPDSSSQDALPSEEDFISFGSNFGNETMPPANAPTGPKASSKTINLELSKQSTLGKRKRGLDSQGDRLMGPRGRQFLASGAVLPEWAAVEDVISTPWLQDCDNEDLPIIALHKEIIDFYEWIKPVETETFVRANVVDRIDRELRRWQMGELKAFGSYATGLYLPTGDMDLVYIIRHKFSMNVPVPKNFLYRCRDFLERSGIARPDSMQVIPAAKVPIIKFVEDISGLRIDLSFQNDSGLVAIETFKKWKATYPALPIIVAVIKQFLMIRGLNDVSVGGIGGFTIICLVTSVLQHLPSTKILNLGEVLIEFFNVYGYLFDRDNVAIRLDPPGYIDKRSYKPLIHSNDKAGRLTVIDPNRPDNNISGGSHEIERVFRSFARAHETLTSRLHEFNNLSREQSQFSFLEDLVGGNFTAYEMQRNVLRDLYYSSRPQPVPEIVPSKPQRIKNHSTAEEHQKLGSDTSESANEQHPNGRSAMSAVSRLEQLKRCRPDLVSAVEKFTQISKEDALKLGGWKNETSMDRALKKKEKLAKLKG